jgi:hypothetical protein
MTAQIPWSVPANKTQPNGEPTFCVPDVNTLTTVLVRAWSHPEALAHFFVQRSTRSVPDAIARLTNGFTNPETLFEADDTSSVAKSLRREADKSLEGLMQVIRTKARHFGQNPERHRLLQMCLNVQECRSDALFGRRQ